ncbi:hypothetical protein KFE25_004839 [Diacronema lutheri]|uniref:mitogen-activated protein kinase kinase n=3 Tax=Diacronema lutheri TaxID=2081491 RepID=A0A8J6CDA2_DIALT|nr:hypothetical protein KFE25_004839 [Diacronema lutheri]
MPIKKPPDLTKLDMSTGLNPRDTTFTLSDSGTFSKDDFTLKARGITQSPFGRCEGSSALTITQSPFGRYEGSSALAQLQMIKQLGSGASSVVKLVYHPPSGQMLALKQLAAMEDPALRQQVINELKVLYDVRCDYLVRLHDAFYLEGIIYLALEFMNAGSLEDVARKAGRIGDLPLGQIMVQVLQGLIFLHKEKHQLHRDLKPANILLSSCGDVKLSDFGISRQLENTMAVAGTFCGTAQYMSPERIVGDGYSYPADVWCVGLIALECAIGAYPYSRSVSGSGYFDLVKAIVDGPLPTEDPALAPVLAQAGLSAELLDFVRHCLRKEATARPTALQLMDHPFVQRAMAYPNGQVELGRWLEGLN